MNNRGFTLIELIATIALLAVISLISFISINSAIKKNWVNNCNSLVDNIKGAANEYVSDNRYNNEFVNMANNNGKVITMDANSLKEYLTEPIRDPKDKSDITAAISATIELNNNYTVKNVTVNGINCDDYYN